MHRVLLTVQDVRTPTKTIALVGDETDLVIAPSLGVSALGIFATVIYGLIKQPLSFNDHDCLEKYIHSITQESIKTNFPCNLEKPGWNFCINSLIGEYCTIDKQEYERQLFDKRIAAWTPLMITATASVAFNSGWLLGKWVARKMNAKTGLESPNFPLRELEREQV